SFASATTADGPIYAIALQPDGRLIVGGAFSNMIVGGVPVQRRHIARFNADGSLDMYWNPDANDVVYAIVLLPDGKIMIGGAFTTVGNQPHGYIARLSSDVTAYQSLNVSADGYTVSWQQSGAGPSLNSVSFE